MDELIVVVSCCIVLGMVTGTLAGLLGIGGGLVIVPVLNELLTSMGIVTDALAMPVAIATSLSTIVVTGFFSAKAHYKIGNIVPTVVLWCGVGIAIGAVLGAQLASVLPTVLLKRVFVGLVLAIAMQMVFGKQTPSRVSATPGILLVVGLMTGVISALMGIGGGAFLVPALVWFQVPVRQAIGCAAFSGLVVAVFGTSSFVITGWALPSLPAWSLGYVYLPAAAGIMATSVFTAGYGARLGQRLSAVRLKQILACVLVLVSVRMIIGME